MRLVCPSCGACHSAEAWLHEEEARAAMAVAVELPRGVGRWALAYLALFRPQTADRGPRALGWKRVRRVLEEIRDLVAAPEIAWAQKAARPNSPEVWARAMEQMCCHPPSRLPLKNHNYLRTIAYDLADEMDKARERAGGGRRTEDRGPHTGDRGPPTADRLYPSAVFGQRSIVVGPSDEQWEENRRRIAELAKGIGSSSAKATEDRG